VSRCARPAAACGTSTASGLWRQALLVLLLVCITATAQTRTIRVGVYGNPPKIFIDARQQAAGILIDLLRKIADEENWTLQFVPCEWESCMRAARAGEIDLLPDVAFSDERAQTLDFHQVPALFSWSLLYRSRNARIGSIFDLHGRTVAVVRGSVQEAYFRQLLQNSGIDVRFVLARSFDEVFGMVKSGQADVAIANKYFGDLAARDYDLSETPIVFQPAKLYYVTGKGKNAELLAGIDLHLKAWQADPQSVYFDILHRWEEGSQPRISRTVWWALAAISALLLVATGAAAYLRREVAARTDALRKSEQSLRIAATAFQSNEAMFVMGPDRMVLEVNDAFTRMTGYGLADLPNGTIPPFTMDDATQAHCDNMWQVVETTGRWQAEIWSQTRAGQRYAVWFTLSAVRDPQGHVSHYVGTQIDITERRLLQEQAMRLAFYDALTDLPNRRLLLDRIQHCLAAYDRRRQVGALLFIDIDNFKDLNDTLGHQVGDQLLKQVAQRLLANTRKDDTVARLGGDEFVILMEEMGTTDDRARVETDAICRKILRAIAEPYALEGGSHHTTCSIGIAIVNDPALTAQDLLRRGDLAMYRAKRDGRHTARFFTDEMETAVTSRTALELELREAIGEQQFFLHYQPQVDGLGRVIGVEALVRWRHPVRGVIPPGVFIPVAEISGQILPIGQWVLEAACRQLGEWQKNPLTAGLHVAVNVSARQFRHPDFAVTVLALLDRTGVGPSRLKIELTESMMIDDIEDLIGKMRILKDAGISFALDDFGTGYSSLSYLKRLPIDQLKIDQSFVRDLLTDPNDAAIARSIVALGEALGLEIIAEGVETLEQRDFLAAIGCRKYQGYLFARPGEPEAILDLVAVSG
jgi:diguanylate cyclase (GGDEF)-like protein/PAS domain S-box-containing protein